MSVGKLAIKGERGYSAYEIAVQNGFEGTEEEWLNSIVDMLSLDEDWFNNVITTLINNEGMLNKLISLLKADNTWITKLISSVTINNANENVYELVSYKTLSAGTVITEGYQVELDNSYIVGNNDVRVFWNGVLLKKATNTEDGHYLEIGEEASNVIQFCRTDEEGDYTLTQDVLLTIVTNNTQYTVETEE